MDAHELTQTFYREKGKLKHKFELIVPNVISPPSNCEMDIACITAKRLVEIEVKISRDDYWRDFSKVARNIDGDRGYKHHAMKRGELATNMYYFLMPVDMVSVHEIPAYAGLIYYYPHINGDNRASKIQVIKKAPILHNRILSVATKYRIALSLGRHYWGK